MKLVSRSLRLGDFENCWKLIVSPRQFDSAQLQALKTAWKDLLGSETMQGGVIYDIDSSPAKVLGFGASVFVNPDWLDSFLRAPVPYGPLSVLMGHYRKDSPILRWREIARANCRDGLDLLVLHVGWRTDLPVAAMHDIGDALAEIFRRVHRGYNIRRMAGETYGEAARDFCRVGGNWTQCSDFTEFFRSAPTPLPPAEEHPFLMTAIRGGPVPTTVLWSMFRFFPPVLHLSRKQQSVLKLAVDGASREEIAAQLGLKPESVRNCFRAALVKARKHETVSKLFKNKEGEWLDSAKQRKILNAFLNEHLEELRPWPRRPLS